MKRTTQSDHHCPRPLARVIWGNIERARYIAGVTDEQLSEALGVSPRSLSNYRRDPSVITLRQLEAVAKCFDLPPETLFGA